VPFPLRDRTLLITGGARGIGLATARAALARGARVTLVDLDAVECERAAASLPTDRVLAIGGDVTDRGEMQRAVAATVERFGSLDAVSANAGIASRASTFIGTPIERFERVLEVNLGGVHRTVSAALPEIVARQGHIVVVSSVYAFMNGMGEAAYAMSKAAVEQFGRALRSELAHRGVGVTVAYFGFIDTDMVHHALDEDPFAVRMLERAPAPLRKRLPPDAAGTAIVDAIESRRSRVIRPRRWEAMWALRGFTGPLLDMLALRDSETQALLADLESRDATG